MIVLINVSALSISSGKRLRFGNLGYKLKKMELKLSEEGKSQKETIIICHWLITLWGTISSEDRTGVRDRKASCAPRGQNLDSKK